MKAKEMPMALVDKTTYMYILGGLMEQPSLLERYDDIRENDFGYRIAKMIFKAICELRCKEELATAKAISFGANTIETQISLYPAVYDNFIASGGIDFLNDCLEYGVTSAAQFGMHYQRLKKLSLLRTLQKNNYDIDYYCKEDYADIKEERETVERFDNATVDDILNHVEGNFQKIKSNFIQNGRAEADAAYKVDELIDRLKKAPNIGPDLNGDWFNTAVRGARPGCFYLKSASSGTGKTRSSVFDACKLCYPIHYSLEKKAFIQECENGMPREARKVLFIVTEMDNEELQTIILAYISRVNEEKILTGNYDIGTDEEWRVQQAAAIMQKYKGNFIIESISDPNLINITAIIKRHATVNKIQYVFFDYIHSTPALLAEFASAKVREDVALMMMANQLKQLAKDYNLFIFSATQVNSEGMSGDNTGFKNETCIRGSKAVADKVDVGYVMTKVSEKELQELRQKLINYRDPETGDPYEIPNIKPNMVLDIYKNRRGQYKMVRIWIALNLGTGERQDLYMTYADNTPISRKNCKIGVSTEIVATEWNTKDVTV